MFDLLHDEPHEVDDVVRAIVIAAQRRRANSTNGQLAIQCAHRNGVSWRRLADLTGFPPSTLRSWGKSPADEGDDQ